MMTVEVELMMVVVVLSRKIFEEGKNYDTGGPYALPCFRLRATI